jgi:MFS family permease
MTNISPSARQRITGTLFITQSLFSAAVIAAFTLMPILAAQLGGSDSRAGVPSTLTLLGRAAAAYPLGWLMDKVGRRLGLSMGFLLGAVGSAVAVLAVLSGSFWGFCAGAFLVGMGRSGSDQSRYVAAEVQPSDQRARVMGLIVFAGTVGSVGGPLLVEPMVNWADRLGFVGDVGPYVAAGGLYLLAWLLTVVFLRPDPLHLSKMVSREETAVSEQPSVAVVERPLREIFGRRVVQLATAAMIIGQLVMTLIMVITPLHMNNYEHTTRAISLVIMAHTMGMFGLSWLTGWLIDQLGERAMIVFGAVVLLLSSIMTPLFTSVIGLAVALFLLGLGWNFCYIAGSSLLSQTLSAAERGRAQGAGEVLVAVSSGAGSLMTGWVFAAGGIVTVSVLGFVFSVLLVLLWGWQQWQGRQVLAAGD